VDEVRPDRVYDSELHSEILVFLNQGRFLPLKWALIWGFIQGTLPLQVVCLNAVGVNNATERELVIVILHSTLLNTLKKSFLILFKGSFLFYGVLSPYTWHPREAIGVISIV
jgi:hypothetical protein